MKAIAAVLVSFLITPSTVLAQDTTAATRAGEGVQASARSSGSLAGLGRGLLRQGWGWSTPGSEPCRLQEP